MSDLLAAIPSVHRVKLSDDEDNIIINSRYSVLHPAGFSKLQNSIIINKMPLAPCKTCEQIALR